MAGVAGVRTIGADGEELRAVSRDACEEVDQEAVGEIPAVMAGAVDTSTSMASVEVLLSMGETTVGGKELERSRSKEGVCGFRVSCEKVERVEARSVLSEADITGWADEDGCETGIVVLDTSDGEIPRLTLL